MAKQEIKLIANNKKAHHDYFLEEKYEAGVELHGTEVKLSLIHISEPTRRS